MKTRHNASSPSGSNPVKAGHLLATCWGRVGEMRLWPDLGHAALGGVAAEAALVDVGHLQTDQPRAQSHVLICKAVQNGAVAPNVPRHRPAQPIHLRNILPSSRNSGPCCPLQASLHPLMAAPLHTRTQSAGSTLPQYQHCSGSRNTNVTEAPVGRPGWHPFENTNSRVSAVERGNAPGRRRGACS